MEERTRTELKKMGRAIRAAREAMGASQEVFAELANIDRTWISRIERGLVNLSWESLSRIAHALKTKPGALLTSAGL